MLWKSESSFFLQFLLPQQQQQHQEREGSGIPVLLTLLPVTVASRVAFLSFMFACNEHRRDALALRKRRKSFWIPHGNRHQI
ncbi:hypothetical protein MUK42_27775 [Musa troglodytarum]|uniref:Uncharacterized protein n=1 Tax=Musa troglodytarum TaxID=320322 RepID=A0A9E7F091_9LILI|nr:hypothetical protein MUK42_27775 [Musa troglodytarum]